MTYFLAGVVHGLSRGSPWEYPCLSEVAMEVDPCPECGMRLNEWWPGSGECGTCGRVDNRSPDGVISDFVDTLKNVVCGSCGRRMPHYMRPKSRADAVFWNCPCGSLVGVMPAEELNGS